MDKFQIDSTLAKLKLKDKISGIMDQIQKVEKKPEVYDYKKLLTANVDLNQIVNEGGNLFFDCPPLSYQDNNMYNIDDKGKQNKDYFSIVDQDTPFAQKKDSYTPRLARDENGELIIIDEVIQEICDENIIRKNYSQLWIEL